MSSDLKNKLSSYEVTPPPAAWDNIAAALDESAIGNKFPATLRNAAVVPPAGAWTHITAALDNNFFSADTAAKLYAMEATPPVAAWAAIARSLDAEKEAAIPEHRRFSPFIRYAAAAAVAGLMIWAGTSLLSGKKSSEEPVAKQPVPAEKASPAKTQNLPGSDQVLSDVAAALQEARDNEALEESKKVYASVDINTLHKKAKNNTYNYTDPNEFTAAGGVRGLGFDEDTYYEPPIDAENYVVLMTPDGNFVRMSKKLGEFVCCISGEEQDPDCIEEMSRLREKMVNRPIPHSPGNFMALVSLVSSLDEK